MIEPVQGVFMIFPGTMIEQSGFDPAEDHIGPFFYEPKSSPEFGRYGFQLEAKHCNTMGSVHGGVLMTFADFALCMAATEHYEEETCVTVSFSCEFLRGAEVGEVITSRPVINRRTGSLVFLSGTCDVAGEPCFAYSSVVKRLRLDRLS